MNSINNTILITLFCIAGCTLTGTSGKSFDTSYIDRIQTGKTTKQDVLNNLGNPISKTTMPHTGEIWQYNYSTKTGALGAKSFIPVVGTLSGNDTTYSNDTVTITFSGNIVSDCTYTTMHTEGTTKLYAYDANSTESTTTKCGNSNYHASSHSSTSKDQIFETQTLLNKHGYSAGNPDGIMGKNTRNAIMNYQQDNGMSVDGKVSDSLLSRLRENN